MYFKVETFHEQFMKLTCYISSYKTWYKGIINILYIDRLDSYIMFDIWNVLTIVNGWRYTEGIKYPSYPETGDGRIFAIVFASCISRYDQNEYFSSSEDDIQQECCRIAGRIT